MNKWSDLSEEVRRGNNRSHADQTAAGIVGSSLMVGTVIASIVITVKTGSLILGAVCLVAGIGGIVGFGAVFWRDRM